MLAVCGVLLGFLEIMFIFGSVYKLFIHELPL